MADCLTPLELVRQVFSVTIPVISGLAGVWLGAYLTTRRERWKERRELCSSIVANLSQMLWTLETMNRKALWSGSPQEILARENAWMLALNEAGKEVLKAHAVAKITLGDEAKTILDKLVKRWEDTATIEDKWDFISQRILAVKEGRKEMERFALTL